MMVQISFPGTESVDLAVEGVEQSSLWTGEGWWLALHRGPEGASRRFGLGISYASQEEAEERARSAFTASLEETTQARLAFYAALSIPEGVTDNHRRAYYKAASVQKVNVESPQLDMPCRWTTPDRMPHRHMWLWDSAFHSLGLQYHSLDLAEDALRALFAKQREDGKLSLAAQPGGPPPEGEDTQPPVVAWSLCRQNERVMRPDFIAEVYPKLVTYIEWFERNRKRENGLYGWRVRPTDDPIRAARGGESGMDNSPRFDNVTTMTAVDLSSYMASEYYSMEKLARCLDKVADAAEWRDRRLRIADLINELLWDDQERFYFDLDEHGEMLPLKTCAGFTPLVGQAPDRDRAESLRMHLMNPSEFWTPFPVPSVSRKEPSFSKDMWRGPTWPNMNVLLYYGLMTYGFFQEARELAGVTVREITRFYMKTGSFFEFYDAMGETSPPDLPRKGAPGEKGGVGFGVVPDLHWTAATYVHLTHELY
jgi:glycogen debranching enzyme